MTAPDDEYVIWSYEHDGFWGPGRVGYVARLEDAGRYSQAEAEAIVLEANRYRRTLYEQALQLLPTAPGLTRRDQDLP